MHHWLDLFSLLETQQKKVCKTPKCLFIEMRGGGRNCLWRIEGDTSEKLTKEILIEHL